MAIAAGVAVSLNTNAQVALTKTLPPIGTTYDTYLHLDPITLAAPATGTGVTWDYNAVTTGLGFPKGTSNVIKSLSQVTEADKDSFPGAVYVEEGIGGVAPYQSASRTYYKDDGDNLIRLGAWTKIGTNPENIMVINDTAFKFNVPYQSAFSTNAYEYKYVGSGTLKIRNNTHDDVAMFKVEGFEQYYFYTVQPFFMRLAFIVLNGDGTGKVLNYNEVTGSTSTPPAAPTDLQASSGKTESETVHLTWTDNANNETGFKVERSTDGTSFTQIADLTSANVQSYDDASADAGTTYHYRVLAYNTIGSSAFSNVAQTTTGTTGIEAIDIFSSLAIYPNPSNTNVTISNVPKSSTVNVIDITGKAVYRSLINNEQTTINTTDFENGVYIIQIANSGVVTHRKLMVSK